MDIYKNKDELSKVHFGVLTRAAPTSLEVQA
jgi:hypothetical protein